VSLPSRLTVLRLTLHLWIAPLRHGQAVGSFGCGGIKADDSVDLSQFQRALDHPMRSRNSHSAAGAFQARKACDDGADRGAVDVRDPGQVEDHVRLALAKHVVEFVLDALAVRAGMDAALHFQHGDAGLVLPMRDLHGDDFRSQFGTP
jgi:hypothetical protein